MAYLPQSQLNAAAARVLLAAGDLRDSEESARAAITGHSAGEWRVYDTIQEAEMHLVLRTVATRTHGITSTAAALLKPAAILSCERADQSDWSQTEPAYRPPPVPSPAGRNVPSV